MSKPVGNPIVVISLPHAGSRLSVTATFSKFRRLAYRRLGTVAVVQVVGDGAEVPLGFNTSVFGIRQAMIS
jgi:hypothetical protein